MKKMFCMMLTIASLVGFTSCSSDEEDIYSPQQVDLTIDYTFVESGSMTRVSTTRAIGADVYDDFYNKYIKTKQLTPTTYSLTFTNQETGATATINGRWDRKDGIRLPEGTYNVTGMSLPKEGNYKEWSDSVHIVFNEIVSINKDDTQLILTAIYDSYLLMFDAENTEKISCKNRTTTSSKEKLSQKENLFWVFMQKPYRNNSKSDDYYLEILRKDGYKSTVGLIDIPFEKGKYYYFNDMTNSFDIPKMESGN